MDYARIAQCVATPQTILKEPISYRQGTAKFTSATVTLQPGESTNAHKRGVPTNDYILSDTGTVNYGTPGKRTCRVSTGFMETMDVWHDGTNDGILPCRILGEFMGSNKPTKVIKN